MLARFRRGFFLPRIKKDGLPVPAPAMSPNFAILQTLPRFNGTLMKEIKDPGYIIFRRYVTVQVLLNLVVDAIREKKLDTPYGHPHGQRCRALWRKVAPEL